MSSNINPNNIDGAYPVAGQDNDSQGFRTNFTNIKNNFVYSKTEMEDLQAKVLLKSALTGTTLDNSLSGAVLRGAEIKDFRETRVDLGTTNGTITLDHTAAHYYVVSTNGTVSLAFTGFPAAGKVGRIRLEIDITDTVDTIVLPASVTYGLQGLAGFDGTDTITFSTIGTYLFEFVTENGGGDIHIADLSRARDFVQSEQLAIIPRTPAAGGRTGDVAGMIAVDTDYIYICTGNFDNGSTLIWKRIALIPYS